jgi:hypothetical protein
VFAEVQDEVVFSSLGHVLNVAIAFDAIRCCVDASGAHGCGLTDSSTAFTSEFHMFQFWDGAKL